MDNMKKLLIEKYEEITGFEPIEEDYVPRIRKMLSTICKGRYTREQIVDCNDTSILSNGASGMVFTTEALCVKDTGNSTSQFIARFKDIRYCSMDEDSFLGVDISAVKLHMRSGAVYRLSTTLDGLDLEQMKEWIEYAMQLHAEETETEQSSEAASDEEIDDEDEDEPQGTGNVVRSIVDNVISMTNNIFSEVEEDDDADYEDEPQETGNVVSSLINNVKSMTDSIISRIEADDETDYEDEPDIDPDDEDDF